MNKPYIKLNHVIIEIISFVSMLIALIYAIIMSATIEGEIPTHWVAGNQIDGYGSPGTLLMMPIMMLITVAPIALIVHFLPADMWNLPAKPKPGKEILMYQNCVLMIVIMELIMGLYTLVFTIAFRYALGDLMFNITFAMLALLFGDIIVMLIKAYKDNK